MENRCPPESVKSLVTPCAFRRRAMRRPPWKVRVSRALSVDIARRLYPLAGAAGGRSLDARDGIRTRRLFRAADFKSADFANLSTRAARSYRRQALGNAAPAVGTPAIGKFFATPHASATGFLAT